MKRNVFWLGMPVTVLALGLVFAGCASAAPIVYDESVPLEQSSTLRIVACWVQEFNSLRTSVLTGKNMFWGSPFGEQLVIIPAGRHSLLLSQETGSTGGILIRDYEFLPGHTYRITTPDVGVDHYTGRIIDEAAFDNDLVPDASSPDATPLEGRWAHTKFEDMQYIFAGNQFIRLSKGKYYGRGFFSFDGQNVTLSISAFYKKDKWVISDADFSKTKFVYDGTLLTAVGALPGAGGFKRAE